MARISGVDLPKEKRIEVALTYIYGIGPTVAKMILEKTKLSPDIKVKDLSDDQIVALREAITEYPVEGDLRRQISMDIKRLGDIGAYRGIRHRKGLPARGQRTKTNARTRRGMRKTVGGQKKEEKK
jgi:small subunit ribosomal protein S13